MQKGKPDASSSTSIEDLLENLISDINERHTALDDIEKIFARENLSQIFKETEQDYENIYPNIMGISVVLCLLSYRLLSHTNNKLPNLASQINLDKLLQGIDTTSTFYIPPYWEQVTNVTLLVQKLLGEDEINHIRVKIENCNLDYLLTGDILGTIIQDTLPHNLRKALASNYTSIHSSKLLAKIAVDSRIKSIVDPFSGSGRLLTSYMNEVGNKQFSLFANEILGVAALLTFIRILYWFLSNDIRPNMFVTSDDAFDLIPSSSQLAEENAEHFQLYDLVIMNPPFTRYLRLRQDYLMSLFQILESYDEYIEKQMGLHVFALFLADRILNEGGRIAAVLPASTFYSEYSRGLMRFFSMNYQINYIISTITGKAFSEGSDLREILFIADKKEPSNSTVTKFITIEEQLSADNISSIAMSIHSDSYDNPSINVLEIPQKKLEKDWNWIRYLESSSLQDLATRFLKTGFIKSSKELGLRIIRGFEMYGPDFFFIPNKNWEIVQRDSQNTIIQNDRSKQVTIDNSMLIHALRRPGLYSSTITPKVDHYVLNIPDAQMSSKLGLYINTYQTEWQVAKNRFGDDWITHVNRQLQSKNPFGHLFIVDKFGITTTGVIAHYTDEQMTASKNFYIVDCSSSMAKILGAWLNSTIFIVLFLTSRREIGGAYGRLQISDYQKEPLLIDPSHLDSKAIKEIEKLFDKLRIEPLPSLKDQLQLESRNKIDSLFLHVLGYRDRDIPKMLELIYKEVALSFENLDIRSKHKRSRD